MILADDFLAAARERGYRFVTGVPCSYLTPLINGAISDPATRYVPATSEGEAVALAAGAWAAGHDAIVMAQNSGLGNMVNPLTSLTFPFRIPLLLLITWRGQPGHKDEPQHELMGRVMHELLDLIQVGRSVFPSETDQLGPALDAAREAMARSSLPFAYVVEQGMVAERSLEQPETASLPQGALFDGSTGGVLPTRLSILEELLADVPSEAAIVATTGKCGRELFTLADRPQHLYLVGAMGGASAFGLGVASCARRPVVVLDGDGAALMKLGNFATIGAHQPRGLVHVLLDNGVHDSTGGQRTVSGLVDMARVALACGYRSAHRCDDRQGFSSALRQALAEPGPHLLHVRIAPGSLAKLGRPTVAPAEVARRFRAFVTSC